MEDDLQKPPASQDSSDDSQQTPPSAETPAAPEGTEDESSQAAGQKKQRDLLAERGRQLKAEEQARRTAESQVVQLNETVQQLRADFQALQGHVGQREQAERDAYLESLPPDERQAEEIKFLKTKIEQLERPAPVDGKAYFRQRSVELLNLANQTYGLQGDLAISISDLPESAKRSEDAFVSALEVLAVARSGGRGARSQESEDDDMPKTLTPAEEREKMKQEILQEIGAGRSNTVRPAAASKTSAPNEEDFVNTTFGYNSKKGPGAMRKQLQEQKDRALAAAEARK